jgi:hypothetical protein
MIRLDDLLDKTMSISQSFGKGKEKYTCVKLEHY